MKRILMLLILLILFISGCRKCTEPSSVSNNNSPDDISKANDEEWLDMREIIFQEGVWSDKDWIDIEFSFEKDCIPDKETAINITKIFIEKFQQQNYFINYVPQSVFYDTEDKIWIVTFVESRDYPGACVSIAIRKENAEVVKIWVGE